MNEKRVGYYCQIVSYRNRNDDKFYISFLIGKPLYTMPIWELYKND